MRRVFLLSAFGAGVWGAGCGGIGSVPADAASMISADAMTGPGVSEASSDDGGKEADLGQASLPVADPDSGACVMQPGNFQGIVCFGSDPAPYLSYLMPDAGVAVGACPKRSAFLAPRGEGSGACGYLACGPLLPAEAAGLVDAGDVACCFWAVEVCGV